MQQVTKDGKGYCITSVPYSEETIKSMKRAGYKVKNITTPLPDGGGAEKGARQRERGKN